MVRLVRLVFAAVLACAFGAPTVAHAVTMSSGVHRNVPYVIGFHSQYGSQTPYVGQMHLNFNESVISGSYTDISTKPGGPLANARNVPVAGGISNGHVTLHIRNVTFRGTIKGDKMSGSASIRGTTYVFAAQMGSPGSGR